MNRPLALAPDPAPPRRHRRAAARRLREIETAARRRTSIYPPARPAGATRHPSARVVTAVVRSDIGPRPASSGGGEPAPGENGFSMASIYSEFTLLEDKLEIHY